MKRFFALLLALSCFLLCFVSCENNKNDDPTGVPLEVEGVPFSFYLNAGDKGQAATATVYRWLEITNSITIPETVEYNGHIYPITEVGLGQNITAEPSELRELVLSKNVKRISECAFLACNNLSAVSLNEGLEVIENSAFYGTNITGALEIPSTVKTIEKSAFTACVSITSVLFSANTAIEKIEDGAFNLCTGITTIAIPDAFHSRIDEIFNFCTAVTNGTCTVVRPGEAAK